MQGCVQCPSGRTTESDPTKQTAITDCYVIPGYGVFMGNTTDTNGPWGFSTNSLSDLEKAQLPVLPCPVGRFGVGNTLDSKCVACTAGTSTQGTMATALTDCSGEQHLGNAWASFSFGPSFLLCLCTML
jgi:hypothetical protein